MAALECEPAAASGVAGGNLAMLPQDAFEQRLQLFYREFGFDYTSYASPTDEEWEGLLLQERLDRESERLVGHVEELPLPALA